jgi:hypothetical protein
MDPDEGKPKRRHLNAKERRELKAAAVRLFTQQYGRRAQKGFDPNDRKYRRDVERQVQQMRPDELDPLLRREE